jgi:hypothetical protein
MLPDGYEQLELFRTSPTGEIIPITFFDDLDDSKKEEEKWPNIVGVARKTKE